MDCIGVYHNGTDYLKVKIAGSETVNIYANHNALWGKGINAILVPYPSRGVLVSWICYKTTN